MSHLARVFSTKIHLGPPLARVGRGLVGAGASLARRWWAMRRASRRLVLVCLATAGFNAGILLYAVIAGPPELRLRSHFVGVTIWFPFQGDPMMDSFIYRTPAPVIYDYSDGSCLVRRWTRVGCFYWGETIAADGCLQGNRLGFQAVIASA